MLSKTCAKGHDEAVGLRFLLSLLEFWHIVRDKELFDGCDMLIAWSVAQCVLNCLLCVGVDNRAVMLVFPRCGTLCVYLPANPNYHKQS